MCERAIFIHIVDGTVDENGYKFNDYSEPRKPNMASMLDFMISTFTGYYIRWRDESKNVVETVIDYLNENCNFNPPEEMNILEWYGQPANVRWEYDSENDAFYSVWIETNERVGDAFKIESARECEKSQEGRPFDEGKLIEL